MSAVLARRRSPYPRISRFGWLMGLYAENRTKFAGMFDIAALAPGRHLSSTGDQMDLCIDIIGQHAYTTELRLTYAMQDPLTGEPDPSAWLRLYHDARQLEATHCYVGRRWQDIIGMYPPPAQVMDHRLRMNTFLGKWLDYLRDRGHGRDTLRRGATPGPPDNVIATAEPWTLDAGRGRR